MYKIQNPMLACCKPLIHHLVVFFLSSTWIRPCAAHCLVIISYTNLTTAAQPLLVLIDHSMRGMATDLQIGGSGALQEDRIPACDILLITEDSPREPAVRQGGADCEGSAECRICFLSISQILCSTTCSRPIKSTPQSLDQWNNPIQTRILELCKLQQLHKHATCSTSPWWAVVNRSPGIHQGPEPES